jgi:hypothetical protein
MKRFNNFAYMEKPLLCRGFVFLAGDKTYRHILPDNKVIFAMSKGPINFCDLASYFKGMGCRTPCIWMDSYRGPICQKKTGHRQTAILA